jgi:hypothetical protein
MEYLRGKKRVSTNGRIKESFIKEECKRASLVIVNYTT